MLFNLLIWRKRHGEKASNAQWGPPHFPPDVSIRTFPWHCPVSVTCYVAHWWKEEAWHDRGKLSSVVIWEFLQRMPLGSCLPRVFNIRTAWQSWSRGVPQLAGSAEPDGGSKVLTRPVNRGQTPSTKIKSPQAHFISCLCILAWRANYTSLDVRLLCVQSCMCALITILFFPINLPSFLLRLHVYDRQASPNHP